MKVRKFLGLGVLLVLVLGLVGYLAWAATQKNPAKPSGKLSVVAAENFYGNIAAQLGGDRVEVLSIISDPEADPHLYESSADNAATVARADVVIVNGVGYDDFMDKLLASSKNDKRQVISAAETLGVTAAGANPHLWYDVQRIHLVAENITASYETLDPNHKAEYQENLEKFTKSLQPLLEKITAIKQKFAGTQVVYTEPVAGYIIDAAGLKDATPASFAEAIEEGTEPSPADAVAIKQLFMDGSARILFYNSQAVSQTTETVKQVATKAGAAVVGVTETLPSNAATYQDWQYAQLDAILKALEAYNK